MKDFLTAKSIIQTYIVHNISNIKKSFPNITWASIHKNLDDSLIPDNPSAYYNEWAGWVDWFGSAYYQPKSTSSVGVPAVTLQPVSEDNNFDIKFNNNLKEVYNFYIKEGNLNIPKDNPLQNWIHTQRKLNKQGKLRGDRKKALTLLNVDFGQQIMSWEMWFDVLKKFKDKYGHCDVPHRYKNNKDLGVWVNHQRQYYRNKILSLTRKSLLEEVGFKWSIPTEERFKDKKKV